jgi:hypothetical protein
MILNTYKSIHPSFANVFQKYASYEWKMGHRSDNSPTCISTLWESHSPKFQMNKKLQPQMYVYFFMWLFAPIHLCVCEGISQRVSMDWKGKGHSILWSCWKAGLGKSMWRAETNFIDLLGNRFCVPSHVGASVLKQKDSGQIEMDGHPK